MRFVQLMIMVLLMSLIAACGQANRNDVNNLERTSYEYKRNTHQDIADRLVKIALEDPNVIDATAVVIGKYAVVGIDLPAKLDSAGTGSIKYSVAQSIKKDPNGANAIVTSDPDTMQRLREMAAAIRAGHPVKGVADELAEIVNRLMPQIPNKVKNNVEPDQPNPKNIQRIQTH